MKNKVLLILLAAMLALSMGFIGCGSEEVPETKEYNITISSTEGGEVTSPGEGTFTYDEGEVVSLVAKADEGYQFVNWTGDIDDIADVEDATTTITMDDNYSITANFAVIPPSQYGLMISSTVGGEVTTPGEGSFAYDKGETVNLVAEGDEGYQFTNWSGNVATVGNVSAASTTISMNGDYSIIASFEAVPPIQYNLTISSTAGGSVTNPGEGTFTYNASTVVSLTATPASGYQFVGWTGDVATLSCGCQSTNITMNGNYSITANFEVIRYSLTIYSSLGGSVATPGQGTFTYNAGTIVSLVASASGGYCFANWTGDVGTIGNVTAASTNITMSASYTITANFEEIPPIHYNLTISSTAGGSATTPGEGTYTYDEGMVVNLVSEAEEGYEFTEWTGDVSTMGDVYDAATNITMNGNYAITANFGSVCGYCCLLNNAITSLGDVEIGSGTVVNGNVMYGGTLDTKGTITGDIIHAVYPDWPTAGELSSFYFENVENTAPYVSGIIDLAGANIIIGPLYRDGTLEIRNSSNTPATLRLAGTLYIAGDTQIGMYGKDLTLDLDGQTIFVAGAALIGAKVTVTGPGALIAVGSMHFAPKIQATIDPILLLSVTAGINFQANGNFAGSIAGNVHVQLQPACSVTWISPAGLNFPSGC